jgi:hypothetical protein
LNGIKGIGVRDDVEQSPLEFKPLILEASCIRDSETIDAVHIKPPDASVRILVFLVTELVRLD